MAREPQFEAGEVFDDAKAAAEVTEATSDFWVRLQRVGGEGGSVCVFDFEGGDFITCYLSK